MVTKTRDSRDGKIFLHLCMIVYKMVSLSEIGVGSEMLACPSKGSKSERLASL